MAFPRWVRPGRRGTCPATGGAGLRLAAGVSGIVGALRRRPSDRLAMAVGQRPARRRLDGAALRAAIERYALRRSRSTVAVASVAAAGAGCFVGGPVLSGIAALYAGAGA